MAVEIEIRVSLPFDVLREEDIFVAHCELLSVASQGDTREEAIHNLTDALTLFLTTCFDMGTFNAVLKEIGAQAKNAASDDYPSKFPADTREYIQIPLPLAIQDINAAACHRENLTSDDRHNPPCPDISD